MSPRTARILVVPMSLFCAALLPACGTSAAPDTAAQTVQPAALEVTSAQAMKEISAGKDVFVLDVRTAEEYAGGHVAGSVLIPVDELQAKIAKNDLYPEVNRGRTPRKNQRILCVCASGRRSARAVSKLRELGYPNCSSIAGGMSGWTAAGLPVEKGMK